MSAAVKDVSGPLPSVLGLWLSSADTGQWCHQAARSVHRGEHKTRNLPVRLGLVVGVVGVGRPGTLPPDGLLVAEHLAGVVVLRDSAVLQLDPRVLGDVVVPDGVLRRPAQRGHSGAVAASCGACRSWRPRWSAG